LDDVGFGQLSPFGGLVNTPNIEKLVKNGLNYTNMHTTALCSPTRSCILTGRNHHSNGCGSIAEFSTGYPGYNAEMPFENGMLSEILRNEGYNTYAVGKWHLAPVTESSSAGPYRHWPLGRGFERFYGFLGGETNQYYPDLVSDNHPVSPPKTPKEGYHLTPDIVDHAIDFIREASVNAPDKPFFLYFCPGAGHAPHQVPKEWADKYKGVYDRGWDKLREVVFSNQKKMGIFSQDAELSLHDPDVPEWDSLSDDQKKLYARQMENWAGFMEHTDHQIGRLLDALDAMGKLENTLIMLTSDNGASSEGGVNGCFNEMSTFNYYMEKAEEILPKLDKLGGPESYPHYAWGWSWAGNTPFRRWKKEVYRGGVSDNFVVHWPAGIKSKGEIRNQYAHAIDMVPTVLEALGIQAPKSIRGVTQAAFEGVSFAHTFDDANAVTKHHVQYFEMFGCRAIYHDGWRADCGWPGPSYTEGVKKGYHVGDPITNEALSDLDAHGWELYHVEQDPAEVHNLADKYRAKLVDMIGRWYTEAGKYKVMPLDGSIFQRLSVQRPQVAKTRNHYTLFANTYMPALMTPAVYNIAHAITAEVEIPKGGAEGVIVAHGGVTGGYTFFVKDKKLHYIHNYMGLRNYEVISNIEVPEGKVVLRYQFAPTEKPDIRHGKGSPGVGQLYINEKLVGETIFPVTVPIVFGIEGLSCGYEFGEAVSNVYEAPFTFTGTIKKVTVDLSGELISDAEAEATRLMAQQ
jgi:arylsulfatase